jgi:hypothetical protein
MDEGQVCKVIGASREYGRNMQGSDSEQSLSTTLATTRVAAPLSRITNVLAFYHEAAHAVLTAGAQSSIWERDPVQHPGWQ